MSPPRRCRKPPVTHASRQRHPPSGCLRSITQRPPSALIHGLNIPSPGVKIGTIWEGPESAASTTGTHRRPPQHAEAPGVPSCLAGEPQGPSRIWRHPRKGDPTRLCTFGCQPHACRSRQTGFPGMLCVPKGCRCPLRMLLSPRDAGTSHRVTTAPTYLQARQPEHGSHMLPQGMGSSPSPPHSQLCFAGSPARLVSPQSWLSPIAHLQPMTRGTEGTEASVTTGMQGQKHR